MAGPLAFHNLMRAYLVAHFYSHHPNMMHDTVTKVSDCNLELAVRCSKVPKAIALSMGMSRRFPGDEWMVRSSR